MECDEMKVGSSSKDTEAKQNIAQDPFGTEVPPQPKIKSQKRERSTASSDDERDPATTIFSTLSSPADSKRLKSEGSSEKTI